MYNSYSILRLSDTTIVDERFPEDVSSIRVVMDHGKVCAFDWYTTNAFIR